MEKTDLVLAQIEKFVHSTTTLILDHGNDTLKREYAKLLKEIQKAL